MCRGSNVSSVRFSKTQCSLDCILFGALRESGLCNKLRRLWMLLGGQKWESGQGGKKHHPSLSAAAAPACIAKLSLPTNQHYPTLPYLTLTHPTLPLPNVKNLYITEQNHPSLSAAAAAACITKLSILPTNQPYPNFKGNTLPYPNLPYPTSPLPNVKNL